MRSPRSSSSSPGTRRAARSPNHGPSHLHDATVKGGPHDGRRFDLTGGWMDAGDMIHFAQTTSFAAAVLEAAARLDPAQRRARPEADGRHPVAAQGAPGARPVHRPGRRPARPRSRLPRSGRATTPRANPASAYRKAYPGIPAAAIGGDIAGKAAAALALAYDRTARRDGPDPGPAVVRGRQGGGAARTPQLPGGFYRDPHWKDSMAGGAAALYRATGERSYLNDALALPPLVTERRPTGPSASSTRSRASPPPTSAGPWAPRRSGAPATSSFACERLRQFGAIAVQQAHDNAFGMPGFLTWGTTAQNGASGALAGLAACDARPSRRTARRGRRPRLHARAQPVRAQLRGRLRTRLPDPSAPLGLGVRPGAADRAPSSAGRPRSTRSAARAFTSRAHSTRSFAS